MSGVPANPEVRLDQGLGLAAAFSLVAGGIIGVSIFLIPGAVAASAKTPGLALLVWVVAGLLSGCAALCFAELGTSIPESGGIYVHLKRAFASEAVAFSYAWMICFAYGSGAIAVVAIMAATYLVPIVLPSAATPSAISLAACGLILAVLALNLSGVKRSGGVQVALTIIKILMLVFLIVVPFAWLHVDLSWMRAPLISSRSGIGVASDFVSGLLLCFFSFSGAFFITQVAGEVRQPERNVSRAIVWGFGVVFALYISINISYFCALPFQVLIRSKQVAGDIMGMAFGRVGAVAISVGIGLSAVAVLNAQIISYPRVVFAVGEAGLFKRYLGSVGPGSRAPAAAIILIGLWSAVLSLTGTYQAILETMAFVSHLFIVLSVAASIILRVKEPSLHRPFKIPLFPITPLVFIAASLVYLAILVYQRPLQVISGLIVVASGLPVYFWSKRPSPLPFL